MFCGGAENCDNYITDRYPIDGLKVNHDWTKCVLFSSDWYNWYVFNRWKMNAAKFRWLLYRTKSTWSTRLSWTRKYTITLLNNEGMLRDWSSCPCMRNVSVNVRYCTISFNLAHANYKIDRFKLTCCHVYDSI